MSGHANPRRGVLALVALGAGLALAAFAVAAPAAPAANTRVSIAHYRWSTREVHVDLGEEVTWDWLGPDLAHSVTGVSPNARSWDSDPRTDAPWHRAGYSYTLRFTQPGVYRFQCKLHPFVNGSVIVSDVPGDPSSDPGPQPPLNIDVKPPTLGGVVLDRPWARGGVGVGFRARISERGSLDAEYYRLVPRTGGGQGLRRVYSGYETWRVVAGTNRLRLGARGRRFPARSGRYLAILRTTDRSNNESKPVRKRFRIVGSA